MDEAEGNETRTKRRSRPAYRLPRHVELTPERRERFIRALASCGNVRASCDSVGVTPQAVYKLRDRDAAFAEAWSDAKEYYNASLEAELHGRVFDGLRRPIFQGGKLVGHETLKSDALLVTALKANMPEKYTERLQATVRHGGGVLVVPGPADPREWERAAAEHHEKLYGGAPRKPDPIEG